MVRRKQALDGLGQDIRDHIERETQDNIDRGMSPEEACLKTLERVVSMTEARLLDGRARPRFSLSYYAVAKDGRFRTILVAWSIMAVELIETDA